MNKEAKIQSIKDFIDARFNTMTNDEFESLYNGDGTLSVLDEALNEHDYDSTLDENDIAELLDYCCNKSTEYSNNVMTKLPAKNRMQRTKERMLEAIKNYIDERFYNMTVDESDMTASEDVVNEAIEYFKLTDDEHSDIFNYALERSHEVYGKYYERFENFSDEHKQLLARLAESMMQSFAETVTAEQYDDLDEWIDFIQKFECFTFQELQYINRLRTDEAKEKYRIQKD